MGDHLWPKPLRNGWRAMDTCPDTRTMVLVTDESGGMFSVPAKGLAADPPDSYVAWMPLPAGPYDDEGAPE